MNPKSPRTNFARWVQILLVMLAGFYLVRQLVVLVFQEGPRPDLDIIITAAKRFMAQEEVYRLSDEFEHTKPPLLMGVVFHLVWLPHFWVRLIWDVLLWCFPIFIFRQTFREFRNPFGYRWNLTAAALTIFTLSPLWFKEAGYGQFNLFNFWLMLLAFSWLRGKNAALHLVAGAAIALTLVIKPTQLYLVPWVALGTFAGSTLDLSQDFVAKSVAARKLFRAVVGGTFLIFILAFSYSLLRSWRELISDHRDWAQYLSMSSAKHIIQPDNLGIPSLLTRMGFGAWVSGSGFLVVTWALTTVVVWKFRRRPDLALIWSTLLMLAFSPMCWRANFGVLILLVYGLGLRLTQNIRDAKAWLGIAAWLVLSKMSPYWLGLESVQEFGQWAGPLWLAILGGVCFSSANLSDETPHSSNALEN